MHRASADAGECGVEEFGGVDRLDATLECAVTVEQLDFDAPCDEDFAGGKMPSNEFGANAAWWQIAVLAMNIASAMKRVVLGGVWAKRRMKAIRFLLISVPGRVVEKARQLCLRLSRDHPALDLIIRMRVRIGELATGPPIAA